MRNLKLLLCIAGLLSSNSAFAGVPGWTISESSGQVSIVATGVSKVAYRGGGVAVGEVVATGTNGRAVLVRGEEYLIVSPNTRIRVVDPARSGGMTQIMELFGNTIFKIKKMATPHFGVQTPYLAAVVKGTTFSVTVSESGASVQVVEGRVEVSTRDGGASYMVLPGDIVSVTAASPMQLNVAGRENKQIISEGPKSDAPASVAEPEGQLNATAPAEAVELPTTTVISAAVSEGPVNLATLSGGLVQGAAAMSAMTATVVSDSVPGSMAIETSEVTPPDGGVASLPPTPAPSSTIPVGNVSGSTAMALTPTPEDSVAAIGGISAGAAATTATSPVVIPTVVPIPNPGNAAFVPALVGGLGN